MKIGIYAPYLTTCGGGEKYICKLSEILSENHEVFFIAFDNPDIDELKKRLNVNLDNVTFELITINKLFNNSFLKFVLKTLYISRMSKRYDIFINQENDTVISARSSMSVYLCQLPSMANYNMLKDFYPHLKKVFKRVLFGRCIHTYSLIVVYSHFVEQMVKRRYPKNKICVLYPPIEIEQEHYFVKENVILNVGRFFVGGHCKKQLEMIQTFKEMCDADSVLNNWVFHLVGGVGASPEDQEYIRRCRTESQGYPIYIHANLPSGALTEVYSKAKIYWHATGLEDDEIAHPELMEHFGMTTAEAMSAGCVPIVINKGGQPEIVRHGIDGFLWNTVDELKQYTSRVIMNEEIRKQFSQSAAERSLLFSIDNFKKNVEEIFHNRK